MFAVGGWLCRRRGMRDGLGACLRMAGEEGEGEHRGEGREGGRERCGGKRDRSLVATYNVAARYGQIGPRSSQVII